MIQGTTTYIHFKWLKFSNYAGSRHAFYIGGNVSNIKLTDCQTLGVDNAWTAISIQGAGYTVSNLSFINLLVNAPSTGATFTGVDINGHITNYSNILFDSCSINSIYNAYDINACGAIVITGGSATAGSTAGSNAVLFTNAGAATLSGVALTRTGGTAVACGSAGNVVSITSCPIVGSVIFGAGDVTFANCSITGSVTSGTTVAAATPSFINCTVTGTTVAFQSNGITGIVITGGTYITTGNGTSLLFGVDGTSGNTTTATLTNLTIVHDPTKNGHGLLFGAGCSNCVADDVTINACFDYAVVVKENTGTEVRNSTIVGGNTAGLTFKAAISANAHNNIITVAAGKGFWLVAGDTGNKNDTWVFQNNIVNVSGTGKALQIGNDTHDLGGGICDYNTYQNNSGLGVVRNDAAVANLTELQAAWADYDVTTNDAHSTVV